MDVIQKTQDHVVRVSRELKIKTTHYILGGFSLVTALAWNSAIKSSIESFYPIPTDSSRAALVYAAFITLILVLLILFLPDTKEMLPKKTQRYIQKGATPPF